MENENVMADKINDDSPFGVIFIIDDDDDDDDKTELAKNFDLFNICLIFVIFK